MNGAKSLHLQFGQEVPSRIRARMGYAFRVFAAIYGHEVVAEPGPGTSLCFYGERFPPEGAFYIPARYILRLPNETIPLPSLHRYAGEEIPLFHGLQPVTGSPDWLAEIFEWLSSSREIAISSRDGIGRISYEATLFGKGKLSQLKPYAAFVTAWLENAITNPGGTEALPRAASPLSETQHFVICSHDIDYYFTNRIGAIKRVIKNMGIGVLVTRSAAFVLQNLWELAKCFVGKRVGDFIPRFIQKANAHGFRSTFFILVESEHRRDANYRLEELMPRLKDLVDNGFTVGLHGSYQSIVEQSDLPREVAKLNQGLVTKLQGNRQHWLRFDSHAKLFENVERAGLKYDSTLGFSETAGFRNGACFAFPPYNFKKEEAYSFLEIPLTVMDSSLVAACHSSAQSEALTEKVLCESRRLGWGGISILWHNPVEPLNVPHGINQIFWKQLGKREQFGEAWVSGEEFLTQCRSRFQAAGLLQEEAGDA